MKMNLPFPVELLEKLACPACAHRPPLRWQEGLLVCAACHRAYPVRDGIPVLLVEESTKWEPPPTEPSPEEHS